LQRVNHQTNRALLIKALFLNEGRYCAMAVIDLAEALAREMQNKP
jgi:hypothetical protein